MISNIPGNEILKGTTLSEYLQPLPTEYAGKQSFLKNRNFPLRFLPFETIKGYQI